MCDEYIHLSLSQMNTLIFFSIIIKPCMNGIPDTTWKAFQIHGENPQYFYMKERFYATIILKQRIRNWIEIA